MMGRIISLRLDKGIILARSRCDLRGYIPSSSVGLETIVNVENFGVVMVGMGESRKPQEDLFQKQIDCIQFLTPL